MKKIRLAIIGTGGVAEYHARDIKTHKKGVEIVACADIVEQAARKFAAQFDVPNVYTDHRELLKNKECDAAIVATPDDTHAQISIAALQACLHVLCEKPMAVSVKEARRMVAAADASGRIVMVNFSYRAVPAFKYARSLVRKGALGEIRHVQASYLQSWLAADCWGDWRKSPALLWRQSAAHHGGALVDIGCHMLDAMIFVAGDIARIDGIMKTFEKAPGNRCGGYALDADDTVIARVAFLSGAVGSMTATRWATGHLNTLRLSVYGTEGVLAADTQVGGNVLQTCLGKRNLRKALWREKRLPPQKTGLRYDFFRSIRAGTPRPPTFHDGLKIQELLEACARSAKMTGSDTLLFPPRQA